MGHKIRGGCHALSMRRTNETEDPQDASVALSKPNPNMSAISWVVHEIHPSSYDGPCHPTKGGKFPRNRREPDDNHL